MPTVHRVALEETLDRAHLVMADGKALGTAHVVGKSSLLSLLEPCCTPVDEHQKARVPASKGV